MGLTIAISTLLSTQVESSTWQSVISTLVAALCDLGFWNEMLTALLSASTVSVAKGSKPEKFRMLHSDLTFRLHTII